MIDKCNYVTAEGLKEQEDRLDYLKTVKRLEVADRLKAAIALGDLSENSEYDDAKNEQAFVEGEILTLEAQIRNSVIIKKDDSNQDIVQLGCTVVIKDLEFDEEETYKIVGSSEAATMPGRISNESPVGAALLGQPVGATVSVKAPAGIVDYKILKIIA